jgi:uncharacterized protein (TIGR02246 family)
MRNTLTRCVAPIAFCVTLAGGSAVAQTSAALTTRDYVEIQQLYARYVHALDRGDAEGYAALFTPDGAFNNNVGREALIAFVRNRNAPTTRHINSSLVISADPEGAKGAVYNIFLDVGSNPPAITGASRYEDTLVKTREGWRFKKRVNIREPVASGPASTAPAPRQ